MCNGFSGQNLGVIFMQSVRNGGLEPRGGRISRILCGLRLKLNFLRETSKLCAAAPPASDPLSALSTVFFENLAEDVSTSEWGDEGCRCRPQPGLILAKLWFPLPNTQREGAAATVAWQKWPTTPGVHDFIQEQNLLDLSPPLQNLSQARPHADAQRSV
jgi:hypothetical protein